jgi:lipoyl(octanoyl) transferase
MNTLVVYRPGVVPYCDALAFQQRCVDSLKRDAGGGYLILLTHPPVVTIGRSGSLDNVLVSRERLLQEGVEIHETGRGGDVTYHGPGQIVGYPIIRLNDRDRDVHAYLRRLEAVLMGALVEYGIVSARREGYTGVWVGGEKIAAIGVAISRWVTYHGFALNIAPDFRHFALIRPCGITDGGVTSMERILGHGVDQGEVGDRLIEHFAAEFRFDRGEQRRREERDPLPELGQDVINA